MRIRGSRSPPQGAPSGKTRIFEEVGMFASSGKRRYIRDVCGILRQRRDSTNLSTAAPRGANEAAPPYNPPGAPGEPRRKGTTEVEGEERLRSKVRSPFPKAGQLALHYLRLIVARDVSGTRARFGGVGAVLTSLAHVMKLSSTRNLETARRYGKLQHEARALLAREPGHVAASKGEPARVDRGAMLRCIRDL